MREINNISTFKELLASGYLPNKVRDDVVGSTIYTVGTDAYYEMLKNKRIYYVKGE